MESIEKETMLYVRKRSDDQMMHGRYPKILEQIVIETMNDHESLASKALETPDAGSAEAPAPRTKEP